MVMEEQEGIVEREHCGLLEGEDGDQDQFKRLSTLPFVVHLSIIWIIQFLTRSQ